MTCPRLQEQLKNIIKAVIDLIKQPFHILKEAVSKVLKFVKVIVKRIKEALIAIKRLVLSTGKFPVSGSSRRDDRLTADNFGRCIFQ